MKPGKIAQDIEDELKRERRRKARALRLKKLIDEYKKRRVNNCKLERGESDVERKPDEMY